MNKPLRITIFGTGGIGGFLAARLCSIGTSSVTVTCIARGEHRDAVSQNGLKYIDPEGEETIVKPHLCTDNPADASNTDLWILCTKGYDLDDVSKTLSPLVQENTVILPLLNGADIYQRMRRHTAAGIILPGCIFISSTVTEPGTVKHIGGAGAVTAGYDPSRKDYDPEGLVKLFDEAKIPFTWQDDPLPAVWKKYLFIAPLSLVTAVSEKTFSEVLSDSKLVKDVRAIMEEIISLARTQGIELDSSLMDEHLAQAASFPPETKTSFQRDVESGSGRDERDILGGTIIKMGDDLGIEVPTATRYYLQLPR